MTDHLRVLIVEDSPSDAELMLVRLQDEGFNAESLRVDREDAFLAALQPTPDVVLADWSLPRFSGRRALELLRQGDLDVPFIIVSGSIGEESAVDALHQGVDDYVLKDRMGRLGQAVRRALEAKRLRDETRRAESEIRLAAAVFQNSVEAITITDAAGVIVAVNPAFEATTGYTEAEALGKTTSILKSGRQDESFYRDMWAQLQATGWWHGEVWNRRKSGEIYPEWISISAVVDARGDTTHYATVSMDVGDVKNAYRDLEFLTHHDALTGLPNQALFADRLYQAAGRAQRNGRCVAVVVIGIDRFGEVNDALGHGVGDALLRAIAERLKEGLDASVSLARLGGDEFTILFEDQDHAAEVARIIQDLQARLAAPFSVDGHEIIVSGTAGMSLYPQDTQDSSTLLQQASAAMRQAKTGGRAGIGFVEPGLAASAIQRLKLERQLRRAVADGELILHFQAQVDLSSRALVGLEALVRWAHPTEGLLPPARFIPVAEHIRTIGEIDAWVAREACRQLAAWDASGFHVPRIAVNLSGQDFDDVGLPDRVRDLLEVFELEPARLEFEVTESIVIDPSERVRQTIADLRSLGVSLSVDDFGIGHSSLAQLRSLPVNRLKLDMSFVRDINNDPKADAIVRAGVALARGLGLQSIAEGVEHEHQALFLQGVGCEVAQGYLFGRPEAAAAIASRWGATS